MAPADGTQALSGPTPSGVEMARAYHRDVVGPLVRAAFPDLRYAAARLGSGSDVLGLDDATSRDHDWGLRLTLLVTRPMVRAVRHHLDSAVPETYAGRPTRFSTTWLPDGALQIEVADPGDFAESRLGVRATDGLDLLGWLATTGQGVLEVVAGDVFMDTDGELTRVRDALRWYPDDLWRYVLAADWSRLAQETVLASRAGERGDDLGSRVVIARMVGTAMHLGFLLERRWAPYPKWRGTLFGALDLASAVAPALAGALSGATWRGREAALGEALESLLDVQRSLGLPSPEHAMERFYDRPLLGASPLVARRLLASIRDPEVCRLPPGVGSVEQWVDNVDVLMDHSRRVAAVRSLLSRERSQASTHTGAGSPPAGTPG